MSWDGNIFGTQHKVVLHSDGCSAVATVSILKIERRYSFECRTGGQEDLQYLIASAQLTKTEGTSQC